MDFDSSSKFISSLAKFLQSLCNGYVEFNSGVEVIGHIYLNVDTGKKIDYILNEKVCKTDENSVTFISNSFHAQPAEKPKPSLKNSSDSTNKLNDSVEIKNTEDEIVIMDEPESKNVGTLPSRDSFRRKTGSPHSKFGRPTKRPHQSFSHGHKHLSKHHKPDPSSGPNGAQHDTESLHSESNSSSNFVTPQLTSETSLAAASDSEISHLSKVFPQSFGDTSNNQNAAEERDIKPQLDSEMNVIQVKQEFSHSEHGEEEQETYDDSQDHSTVFPGMPYDQYYLEGSRRGHRSEFGQAGLSQDFFPGAGPSGEGIGDSSDMANYRSCDYCGKRFQNNFHLQEHIHAVHYGLYQYNCPKCDKTFAYKRSLKRHILLHSSASVQQAAPDIVFHGGSLHL
ncbi:zinc finger protein 37 homolog isoform X25 [Physella acuta]|uniref:zinc finger protein 37 homolog isoform X25 n=1 Tax=Physella acuta TaxID=109671 RepID=UPI0027DE0000|nr:zinc finger protein 37 homolog isoform X25 [Physella acuta]